MRWAWLFLATCAVGAIVSYWPREAAKPFIGTLPILAAAPSWTLADTDGHEVHSVDFKGQVVLVDFWATWCPPCLEEIPGYIALQKKYSDQGLVVLGVSMDTTGAAVVKRFVAEHRLNYQVLMADDVIGKAFGGVNAIPTTFLIDRTGRIRHRKVGTADAVWYESVVASVLRESVGPVEAGPSDSPAKIR